MIYQFDSRVRYSEVDRCRKLTLPGIINYFQDCSTFHSEAVDLGLDYMEREKRIWVLSFWQIVIDELPAFGEKIAVQTWPYQFKGFMGSRNFRILGEDDRQMVYANSLWSFLDTQTGRPVKAKEDQLKGYTMEEKLPMDYASRKIILPNTAEEMEHIQVQGYQLDTNNHVNNGQYVQMAHEFLPEDFPVRQLRAEYKKQAVLHDVLIPYVHSETGNCTVALCNEKQEPYAVIAFDE